MPIITSNTGSSHYEFLAEGVRGAEQILLVSPYLTDDFSSLFEGVDLSSAKSITLVTTLKKNDQDQITKPASLKSFYQFATERSPCAKIKIHVDNSLHGKVYIFKKGDSSTALVTSANLTHNGLHHNHEWGLLVSDPVVVEQLEQEVLACIDYPDVTESMIDRLVMFSEQYQRDHPEWGRKVTPSSDILESVYNQGTNNSGACRYWLKPIGVSEDPINKESQRDFSELHYELGFSKKGVGAIKAGDVVITVAVGCGCLLSYYRVTGSPREATQAERELSPWLERWPWRIEGRNLSSVYGGCWWQFDLDRKRLLDQFLAEHPDELITKAGSRSLGAINFGSDKVELTDSFGGYLIQTINNCRVL